MASLSALKSSLRSWQSKYDDIESKIKKLKRRKKDVEGLQNTLQKVASNNSGDINRKLNSLANSLQDGMEYQKSLDFSGKNDNGAGDGDIAAANSSLSRELSRISGDISDKNSELEYAKQQISSYRSQINAEERRQRQERLKRLSDGVKDVFK